MSKLTAVVTHVNDGIQLSATLRSIRETAGDEVAILVVDDCSGTDIEAICPDLHLANRVIKNTNRVGVDPSRTIGVMKAKSEFVLLLDSHCRFPNNWHKTALDRLASNPQTIFCTTCVGLDRTHMQMPDPAALYHGARMNFSGVDPNDRTKKQVLEAIWNKPDPADNAEIGAVMGGAYFISRDWFLKLDALRFLRIWGSSEVAISLASWLSGGSCKIITAFGIAHIFLSKGMRQPWTCPMGPTTYNKLFILHTLLPQTYGATLRDELRSITDPVEWAVAEEMAKKDWAIFETERLRFKGIFARDFKSYTDRFPAL